jgi:molybdopterin-guanine dinucleotide biosynthesis protein A
MTRAEITGAILCGGAGKRFHGRDKPLQMLDGAPLVLHVRRRLVPQVARVIISCNRNLDTYSTWGDSIVVDDVVDRGPLGGVLAAMTASDTRLVFVCPGDAPWLSNTLVCRLADALHRAGADVAVPHDGERSQHLFVLLRRSLAPALRSYLDDGGRSVHGFVDRQRKAVIDAAGERESFFDVNSDAELAAAAESLRDSAS